MKKRGKKKDSQILDSRIKRIQLIGQFAGVFN